MARKQVKSVSGKVVAITGGARGIGKATATALVRKGARVAIGDLDLALAEQTATELGGGVVAFELDVTDRNSFEGYLDAAEKELGPIDVLVNNAGIMPVGVFADESDETAHLMIDINLHGVIYGTKLALERMLPRRSGHIVNIASQAGKAGIPGGATFTASSSVLLFVVALALGNRAWGFSFGPSYSSSGFGTVGRWSPTPGFEAAIEARHLTITTTQFLGDLGAPRPVGAHDQHRFPAAGVLLELFLDLVRLAMDRAGDPLLGVFVRAADVDHPDLATGNQRPRLLRVDLLGKLLALPVPVLSHRNLLRPPLNAATYALWAP